MGSGATRKVRQIAGDNRFFRLEVHSVSVEGGGVIDDWMYCEVPDMVRRHVRLKGGGGVVEGWMLGARGVG